MCELLLEQVTCACKQAWPQTLPNAGKGWAGACFSCLCMSFESPLEIGCYNFTPFVRIMKPGNMGNLATASLCCGDQAHLQNPSTVIMPRLHSIQHVKQVSWERRRTEIALANAGSPAVSASWRVPLGWSAGLHQINFSAVQMADKLTQAQCFFIRVAIHRVQCLTPAASGQCSTYRLSRCTWKGSVVFHILTLSCLLVTFSTVSKHLCW